MKRDAEVFIAAYWRDIRAYVAVDSIKDRAGEIIPQLNISLLQSYCTSENMPSDYSVLEARAFKRGSPGYLESFEGPYGQYSRRGILIVHIPGPVSSFLR